MNKINCNIVIPYTVAAIAVTWALSHHQFVLPQRAVTLLGLLQWGPIATIIVGYYAVRKAVKNYTEQKWWERRVLEYTKAVDAVSLLYQDNRLDISDYDHWREHGESTERYIERSKELRPKVAEAREYLSAIATGDSFILSEKATQAIKKFIKGGITSRYYEEHLTSYDKESSECLKLLNECAVKDLDIKR